MLSSNILGCSLRDEIVKSYDISPAGYLSRAKERLEANSPADLFYAALELRCFVEARQDEYLEAQKKYARSVPKAWKTSDQGKALDKIFDSEKIQHLVYVFDDDMEFDFYYMPVTAALRNGAERLSNLIHAQMEPRHPDSDWWVEKKNEIVRLYRLAWFCCQGNIASPAMLRKGAAIGDFTAIFRDGRGLDIVPRMVPGVIFRLKVEYPLMPPNSWKCNL